MDAHGFTELTETQFSDFVKGTNGIGTTLGGRIESFASTYNPPESPPEPLLGDEAVEFEADASPSFARKSTLDEFQ